MNDLSIHLNFKYHEICLITIKWIKFQIYEIINNFVVQISLWELNDDFFLVRISMIF